MKIEIDVQKEEGVGYSYYFQGQIIFQHPYDNEAAQTMAFDIARKIISETNNKQKSPKV